MPPRILLEQVAKQAGTIAATPAEQSPLFVEPAKKLPANFSAADQARLRAEMLAAIGDGVIPAYAKFTRFVAGEYAPRGRIEPGLWSLEASIAKNPKLHVHSREEMLDLYRKYTDAMWKRLPEFFSRLPKAKVEILPVELYREKEAPGAEYVQGTPDGRRPGHVMVNTSDFQDRTTLSIETTSYHEGVPGHHLQISIAQELPTLPPFRQHAFYTAYTEGWALHAERLGEEAGFFQDPYSMYGHVQDDLLRAIRLVRARAEGAGRRF